MGSPSALNVPSIFGATSAFKLLKLCPVESTKKFPNTTVYMGYVIVISQTGVGYHCYYRDQALRSSVNNNDILRVLVI